MKNVENRVTYICVVLFFLDLACKLVQYIYSKKAMASHHLNMAITVINVFINVTSSSKFDETKIETSTSQDFVPN